MPPASEATRAPNYYRVGVFATPDGRYQAGIKRGKWVAMVAKPTTGAKALAAAEALLNDIRCRTYLFIGGDAATRGLPYEVRPEKLYPPDQRPPSLPPSTIPVTCARSRARRATKR